MPDLNGADRALPDGVGSVAVLPDVVGEKRKPRLVQAGFSFAEITLRGPYFFSGVCPGIAGACPVLTSRSSTSKFRVALGGILLPAPFSP